MDRKQIVSYLSDSESYLEQKGVYQLFDQLLKQLIITQPNDPIDFLVSQIQKPEGKKIFLLGPPGGLSEHLCDYLSRQPNIATLQAGKLISQYSQTDSKTLEILKKFTNIPNTTALEIMSQELGKIDSRGKTLIIEGFPKTRIQALEWQKKGIIPEAVVVLKMEKEEIVKKCLEKIQKGKYEHIRKQDQEVLAINYAEEYILQKFQVIKIIFGRNLQQVKELYQNIYEIEEESSQQQAEEQISKLIQYKIYKQIPAHQARIFIQGMPGAGKTCIAKYIAKNYGITYISINDILAEQIRKKTAVGRRVLQDIQNNQLVPDEIIIGLLHMRLQKTDCQVSGYIVDGFPKTQAQLNSIKELKIKVSNIFILELETTDVFERISGSKIDPKTGIIYEKYGLAQLDNEEIKARLYEVKNATEEQISERIKRWKAIQKQINQMFENCVVEINGLLPEESIREKVCEVLDSK